MASSKSKTDVEAVIERLKAAPDEGLPEDERVDLKDYSRDELCTILDGGLGLKSFRGDQVFQWLYVHRVRSFDEMTNLSKDLRARLEQLCRISPIAYKGAYDAKDGTTKLTYECDDGAVIESVFLPFRTHNALCISSQVGCAMGCTFCYTAKMGLSRQLSVAEIVDQVVRARDFAAERDESIKNIVFMGMGEPLHNLSAVITACEILTDQHGLDLSRRRVTVSTSGLVDAIKVFMDEATVQLAVSLNATTDVTRSKIMPINDRWNLEALMTCLEELDLEKRQRITFEYVLLAGVNDSLEDAQRIIELTRNVPSKINLIPFNPHPDTPFTTPDEKQIDAFKQYLVDRNVSCFRRKTRGNDEMAACGQLGKPGDGKAPRHLRKRLEVLHEELG